LFLEIKGSGAWPFLVRGMICLVNSDNERDSIILTRYLSAVETLKLVYSMIIGSNV
ncbi:unnamed protein product, partial [Diamesa hyperborea]